MKRAITATLILLLSSAFVTAQSVTISQIDASRLLTRQLVDLYVSLTDDAGEPIEGAGRGEFRVSESTDGEEFEPVPVTDFNAGAAAEEGITFFLLVDNSGSMYDTLEGRPTDESSNRRIAHARSAIRTFLSGIDNPRDEVGLASFNTFYTMHAEPTRDTGRIDSLLDDIQRPERREAFTELYASIREAVDDVAVAEGRTALIVLSDGENYPYHEYTGEEHPEYGDRLFSYQEAVERAQREGISVYAVNFSPERDSNLDEIATESGGRVYDARNQEELAAVYEDIRRRVLEEYRITYRATVAPPSESTYVSSIGARGSWPRPRGSTLQTPYSGHRPSGSGRCLLFPSSLPFSAGGSSGACASPTDDATPTSRSSVIARRSFPSSADRPWSARVNRRM
ncbi:MAG: VWA domain-containing protein [Spirochaetia bacterium]